MIICGRHKPGNLYIFMGESNWRGDWRRIVHRAKSIFEDTGRQNVPDYAAYSPVPISVSFSCTVCTRDNVIVL